MTFRPLFIAAAAALIAAPIGAFVGAQARAQSSETYQYLDLFGEVLELVKANYVEDVDDKELIEAAINGMLTSLDPHSSFLSADTFQDMQVQTKGEFGGLGIEVTMENGFVKVVSPIDDTPAFRAGVKSGDFITHLDGEAVLGLTLSEAVDRMRGKVGDPLDVTVRREGRDPFDITIVRDVIRIRSVRSRVEGDVGYLRVTTFNEQTTPGVIQGVEDIMEEAGPDLKGFVLDLRNNPGGLLDEAVGVSDAFLEQGEIVSTRSEQKPDEAQRFNAEAGDIVDGLPLVVIINGGSASASEIVAGALQDHRRAIVLGENSFGKGSVQTIRPVRNRSAVRLTTQYYYTPSGRSIQQKGIEPDILVEAATINVSENGPQRSEADLRGSLVNPEDEEDGGTDAGAEASAEDAPAETQDYQLSRALDLIRGLSLYNDRVVAN
ncbi:MAG: S41 family peptidase [Pseudomonadota bacterium]